ncbi:MAG: DegQ family serine endoprotease [Gemmatimonadota bacterium]|nr:DegQ family serine endoprotease [Gemmatimonadota bacterium]
MPRNTLFDRLLRTAVVTTFLIVFPSCNVTPPLARASGTQFGAAGPPLPSVETRIPGFKQVIADVAQEVIPVVVSIRSAKIVEVQQFDPFEWFFGDPRGRDPRKPEPRRPQRRRSEGIGSGVIVSADGYVLTNNHVVQGADELVVTLSDKREFQATIVGTDPPSDIAVIKLEDASGLPVAYLGDSDKLRIGEMVVAVGSPYGLSETVTSGIVSALGRSSGAINEYENFIQTDAAINPGNSGGALVDLNGAVVGINSNIYSRTGGNQGIGFAIPVNMARQIMESLVNEGKVSRGYLGVMIQNIEGELAKSLGLEASQGVLVGDVSPDTPAEKAGIEKGDVVIEVNGEEVTNTTELRNKVAMIKPGTKARFRINRNGKDMTFKVVLMERPESEALALGGKSSSATREKTGLTLTNLSDQNRERYGLDETAQGVLIIEIEPASPAARTRLRVGDIIQEVDRKPVKSVSKFNKAIAAVDDGNALLLVSREGGSFFAALRLEE